MYIAILFETTNRDMKVLAKCNNFAEAKQAIAEDFKEKFEACFDEALSDEEIAGYLDGTSDVGWGYDGGLAAESGGGWISYDDDADYDWFIIDSANEWHMECSDDEEFVTASCSFVLPSYIDTKEKAGDYLRKVAKEFFQTKKGKDVLKAYAGQFSWGDFVTEIPDEFLNERGIFFTEGEHDLQFDAHENLCGNWNEEN